MIDYSITFNNNMEIANIHYGNKFCSIHLPTNFPNYSLPPNNLYINEQNEIVRRTDLPSKWKSGNFIEFNGERLKRVSQSDYDYLCFNNNIDNKANSDLYKYILEKLKTNSW